MIDFVRVATSVGVGGLDEAMEWWDEKELRTESFRKATDISRLVLAGLGYALQIFMPKQARFGETLATAYTPLLTKSVLKPIRAAIAPAAGRVEAETVFIRRRAPVSAPSGRAGVPSPGMKVAAAPEPRERRGL